MHHDSTVCSLIGSDRLQLITAIAIALGLGVLVWGLSTTDMYSALPRYRFRDLLWLTVAASAATVLSIQLLRLRPVAALAISLFGAHVVMSGFGPIAAVLLLATAALGLGHAVLRRDGEDSARNSVVERVIVGMALLAGVAGWMLPYAVHLRLVYLAVLLGLLIWQWPALRAQCISGFHDARAPASSVAAPLFFLLVVTMTLSASWLPVMMSDDLGYHLALPTQLMVHGHYLFNLQDQVWALSPWAGDVLHGIVMVLAGQESIGALNSLWLLLAMASMWRMLRRFDVAVHWRWLGMALFASTPLLHLLMNSMQTELASIAVLLALCDRVLDAARSHGRTELLAVAVLAAFLLALKFSNVAFVAPVLVWWLIRQRPIGLHGWGLGLLAGVLVAGSSYVYAAWLSGNPLLPLYNSVFKSSVMPTHDFANSVYQGLLSWDVLYQATFDTSRFFESPDGGFGFQWLGFCGALIAALWLPRLRALALVALAAILIIFVQMQYLRYLMPAMALIAVVITAVSGHLRHARAVLVAVTVVITLLNVHFMSQGGSHLNKGTITGFFKYGREGFADRNLAVTAPERLVLRALKAQTDAFPTVLAGMQLNPPFTAELAGRGLNLSWYAADFWTRTPALEADASGAAYLAYLRELGIDHVLLRPEWTSPAFAHALDGNADMVATHGMAQLYRMHPVHFDLNTFLTESQPNATGFTYRIPVDPSRPYIAEIALDIRCAKKGWAVVVAGVAHGRNQASLDPRTSYCGAGNIVSFRRQLQLPYATTEWELQVYTNAPDNPLELDRADAGLRPDAPRERDFSARLRLF